MSDIDLSKIFIRAQIKGKWVAASIEELVDQEEYAAVNHWLMQKAIKLVGLSEGEAITKEHYKKAIELLEKNGVLIAKLK